MLLKIYIHLLIGNLLFICEVLNIIAILYISIVGTLQH